MHKHYTFVGVITNVRQMTSKTRKSSASRLIIPDESQSTATL